jgi:asparagine synthase (glutamine-hydrolysing)
LPASILNRRKQGFVMPVGEWFRGELVPYVQERIASSKAGDILNLDYCSELLRAHRDYPNAGYAGKIWVILCFLLWHQQFTSP